MKKRTTPQEKKIRDYKNQTTNTYSENDKSSRKSIQTRKAIVNRTYRHKVAEELREIITSQDADNISDKINSVKRENWKKAADSPIVMNLTSEYNRDKMSWDYNPMSELQSEALKRLKKSRKT